MLWALCLKSVRKQWQRIALMQTNREDVGDRWREILLPLPKSPQWAHEVSTSFRDYFTALAGSRGTFQSAVRISGFEFIASVTSELPSSLATSGRSGRSC